MAYFCAAELLANAIKHSSANVVEIIIDMERTGVLRVRVTDDGTGGADPSRGTGLEGLAQRASTVDGAVLREGLARLLTDRGHEVGAAVADAGALTRLPCPPVSSICARFLVARYR
jgi:glucose-6-phosphate-specific signal transduction histidine kinase